MKKCNMSFYICSNCGYGSGSWIGKCPDCGAWNTLKEQPSYAKASEGKKESIKKLTLTPLSQVKSEQIGRKKTGIYEFDRVLGGGFAPGEVILLTGEPGIGKSTLVLQSLQTLQTVYASGEEGAEQVKDRADRLGIALNGFMFSNDTQIEGIIEGVSDIKAKPDILIVDSIQTLYSADVDSPPGSISQLKETAKKLIMFAKKTKTIVFIIGHVTKEGDMAGPKTLEHLVDCVLEFEGERISHYRLLRASKNRFGATDEIGIFEMKSDGLKEVTNPAVFLEEKKENSPGKATIGVIEGNRPLFFEIQTLVVSTALPIPRRVVKGLDYNKSLLLLAVLKKQMNLPLDKYFDIYANVIGGFTIKSTSSDLGFIASLMSSYKNIPLPPNSLFIGEVGLLGEVRPIFREEKIIIEAKRLGFKEIYSSKNMKNIKELTDRFYKKTFPR